MNSIWHLVAAVVGAWLGAVLAGEHVFIALLLGGTGGVGFAELLALRARWRAALSELDTLRRDVIAHRQAGPGARAPAAPAATTPAAPPTPYFYDVSNSRPAPPPSPSRRPANAGGSNRATPPPQPPWPERWQYWLENGNWLVRTGVIILFFGTAFLLRYAAQHTHVPIEVRLAGVSAAGLGLLAFGWRLRDSRPSYAQALQGGALGIEYLTVFAALHFYHLIEPVPALALLCGFATLLIVLSLRQASQALAVLAVTGGFLAPLLASQPLAPTIALLSYIAVLNLAIFWIGWVRAWSFLKLAGLIFTFGLVSVIGSFDPLGTQLAVTECFLPLFFLMYVALGRPSARIIDGALIVLTPLLWFVAQASLLHDRHNALALSALTAAVLYSLLYWHSQTTARHPFLIDAQLSIAVAFLSIAIPIGLGSRWHLGAWSLEGASLVWFGCRQRRSLARAFGLLVLAVAGWNLPDQFELTTTGLVLPAISFASVALFCVASTFAGIGWHRYSSNAEEPGAPFAELLAFAGLASWFAACVAVLPDFVPSPLRPATLLAALSLTALALSRLHWWARLRVLQWGAWGLLPVMLMIGSRQLHELHHPLACGGWFAWPIAFGCFFTIAHRLDRQAAGPPSALHAIALWLAAALLGWEGAFDLNRMVNGSREWGSLVYAWVPMALSFLLSRTDAIERWPLSRHRASYQVAAPAGLMLFLCGWNVISDLLLTGDLRPLPYVPVLNALDITQLLSIGLLVSTARRLRSLSTPTPLPAPGTWLTALGFLWVNAVLLRTLHQWTGLTLDAEAITASILAQTCLSLTWTVLALGAMWIAHRRARRTLWNAGGLLIAVVVIKLFALDLSSSGSIERIVSFVGVGLLLLVIGYVAPRPPKQGDLHA